VALTSFGPELVSKLKLARSNWERTRVVNLKAELPLVEWTPDESSDRCELCESRFGMFLRMHVTNSPLQMRVALIY
jgi:hypothetical protein